MLIYWDMDKIYSLPTPYILRHHKIVTQGKIEKHSNAEEGAWKMKLEGWSLVS